MLPPLKTLTTTVMTVAVVIADRNDDNMAGFMMVCESLLSARLLEMTVFMATKTLKLTSYLLVFFANDEKLKLLKHICI